MNKKNVKRKTLFGSNHRQQQKKCSIFNQRLYKYLHKQIAVTNPRQKLLHKKNVHHHKQINTVVGIIFDAHIQHSDFLVNILINLIFHLLFSIGNRTENLQKLRQQTEITQFTSQI